MIRPLDPTLTPPDIATFRHWELGEEIQSAIEGMGITKPSPIQSLAIGPVLAGKDVIAKAETGTGKTLAFGAPMMAKIDPQRASVLGLVLCPTRELAEQVQKVLSALGQPRGIEVALIVGGEPMEPQVRALKRGAQVVVGTPGRVLDLYKQKFLNFPWTEFAILDEADVMFEFGFIDDVKEILSYTPDERQTLLFSATFPVELLKLARENTRDPAEVATASGLKTVDNIEQSVIFLDDEDRTLALMRLIENSDPEDVFLVFCPRRTDVDKLIRRLERMPFAVKALHGGYDQASRFRVMGAFRTGEVKALIATDVASRGLDVAHVTTVVNYGSPHDITDYTHRIGRTGRAGRKGRAITLVGGIDRRKWTQIEREATWKIPEVDPPLRGERPRGPRHDAPVAPAESPRRERSPAPRREAAAAHPAAEAPRRESAERGRERPERAPRRDERPPHQSAAPRPAADRADARSWPRDEHSPTRARAPREGDPERQIEPRPDDPVDRRDRPLRQRAEAPRWPRDDDAPAHDAPAGDVEFPRRSESPRGRPAGPGPRSSAASAESAHRRDTSASRAPSGGARTESSASRGPADRSAPSRGARTESAPSRGATADSAPSRGSVDRGAASRGARTESAPGRESIADSAPTRGATRGDERRAPSARPQSRGTAPRERDERARTAEPALPRPTERARGPQQDPATPSRGQDAPRRAAFTPLDVEPEQDRRPRGPDPRPESTRRPAREGAAPHRAREERAPRDESASRAPGSRRDAAEPGAARGSAARAGADRGDRPASRGESAGREPARREPAPRREPTAPRQAAPREATPRREPAPQEPTAPPSRPASTAREGAAPRPPGPPRRRIAPTRPDSGEVRPLQSRERETRRDY